MLFCHEAYGRDVGVREHTDRKIEQEKLPVIEVQHESNLMEHGSWGFTQEGQETPQAADASAAVKNVFRLQSD